MEGREGRREDSPLEVHGGDVEDDSFKPKDHKKSLGEGAVPDALSIASRLQQTQTERKLRMRSTIYKKITGTNPRRHQFVCFFVCFFIFEGFNYDKHKT